MTTFTVSFLVDIDEHADEYLQTPKGVEDEVRSWLGGLGAGVRALVVGALPSPHGLSPQELAKFQYRFMEMMERVQQTQKGVLAAWLDQRPER
jgi:hypothetical protein